MNSALVKIPLVGLLAAAVVSLALLVADSGTAAGSGTADAHKAIAKARAATSGGLAYDIESERRAGRAVWEVKVATGGGRAVELDVSATGGRIVHRHPIARPGAEATWVRATKVSLATAVRTASHRASGRFDEAELDREHGRLVWSAEFGSGAGEVEVEVDATSGRVVGTDDD